MGFGGILAAMAHGLGHGMVENVKNGWEDDRIKTQLDWRTNESDKQRKFDAEQLDKKHQYDIELDDHKTQNAINEATAKARIAARYARSGSDKAQKNLTGAIQTLGVYDHQLSVLTEKMESTEDKSQREALAKQIAFISSERANYLNQPETIAAFKGAKQMGHALYATSGGDMDLFDPKPVSPDVTPVVSAPPKRNMVDMDNLSPEQAQKIATQKREQQGHSQFLKASDDAKEWAMKRNQYTQSTFVPRVF